jgi:predicted NUDIX family NTP pyrophosphohydrolase
MKVLLGHPGGPFWAHKDEGAWSIPKGEAEPGEDLLQTAQREVEEEVGVRVEGPFASLGEVTQTSGKIVHAWAAPFEGVIAIPTKNLVEIEWPPKSGRRISFPELDRAELFSLDAARTKINPAQAAFLDRLSALLAVG